MSDGIHGTLSVGKAGELTGTRIGESANSLEFMADGLTSNSSYFKDEVTFTPDPPTVPTTLGALAIAKDGNFAFVLLLRGWTHTSNGYLASSESVRSLIADGTYHVVFEGVEEQ